MSRPRCSLCGEFESENVDVFPDFDACSDCIQSLVENEIERRSERAHTKAMEAGFDAYTGDLRLRDEMAEARKYK